MKTFEIRYLVPCNNQVGGLSFLKVLGKNKDKAIKKFRKETKKLGFVIVESVKECKSIQL